MQEETFDAVTRAWQDAAHRDPVWSDVLDVAMRALPDLDAWVGVPTEKAPILLGVHGAYLVCVSADEEGVDVSYIALRDVGVSVRHRIVEYASPTPHRCYVRTWTVELPDQEPLTVEHEQVFRSGVKTNVDAGWRDARIERREAGLRAILDAVLSTARP